MTPVNPIGRCLISKPKNFKSQVLNSQNKFKSSVFQYPKKLSLGSEVLNTKLYENSK